MIRRADLDLEVSVELGFKVLGFSWFFILGFYVKVLWFRRSICFSVFVFFDSLGFGVTFKLSFLTYNYNFL